MHNYIFKTRDGDTYSLYMDNFYNAYEALTRYLVKYSKRPDEIVHAVRVDEKEVILEYCLDE